MKRLTSDEIRRMWLDFFQKKGHIIEHSSSLIPVNDPTLLWINSGVAALKQYFDGSVVPRNRRITNAQKCIRTNDIESVGYTARHHTFFEMLGNFSIGDYFREKIIPWALEILTSQEYFALDINRLYFTYYPNDFETRDLWLQCGVHEDHLIPLPGNFWEIGAGPSGPNTEVFFDRGEKYDPDHRGIELLQKDLENDRYIEIWGIVFSQFNANPELPREQYPLLPSKNVDTGAGLERIACVLQETETNFETDLFTPIKEEIQKLTLAKYEKENLISYRIIMDHIRALVFSLSDGAYFDNTGRGYVLRRLLRRASIHGDKLKIKPPFLYKLVDTVVDKMGGFYTNLHERRNHVKDEIKLEEEKFIRTLKSGRDNLIRVSGEKKTLDGKQLFILYDTYGLPLDLSLDFAEEMGIKVDTAGFEELLNEQKERARSARGTLDSMNSQSEDLLGFKDESSFTYNRKHIESPVIALFKNGQKVDVLKEGERGEVVLLETNFYAESGGQIADIGILRNESTILEVQDVQKAPNGQHLHQVLVSKGEVKVYDILQVVIDRERRLLIMRNHSATHLLQAALNEVLGIKIHQLGSFVNDQYLRFDFSFEGKISEDILKQIENKVNEYISRAYKNLTIVTTLEKAINAGAVAEFGDKYNADQVRVVSFGMISKELCGGTHVDNTEDIGIFLIESEQGIAKGVRRIQAVTSYGAYLKYLNHQNFEKEVMHHFKAKSSIETLEKIHSLNEEYARLNLENNLLLDKIARANAKVIEDNLIEHKGVEIIIDKLDNISKTSLIKVNDDLKSRHPQALIVLFGIDHDVVNIVASSGALAVSEGFKANAFLSSALEMLRDGRGGGKETFAQGSSSSVNLVDDAIISLKGSIK